MDTNKNGQCDANEPTTRSAQDGSYSLPINMGADIVADIGVDAFVAEKGDFSDRKPVAERFTLRLGNALWTTENTAVSALSTIVSADMDSGTSLDAAKKKLADKLAMGTAKVLGNYNLETDAMVQGMLQGYGKNQMPVLQDVAASVDAGQTASKNLALETRNILLPVAAAGSIQYVWTQVGTSDTPFSKLEVTGINAPAGSTPAVPSLSTNPAAAGANIGAATFTTQLVSANARLVTSVALVARAIVQPDASGNASCPKIRISGVESAMMVRAPAVTSVASRGDFYGSARLVDFPVLTCEAALPATACKTAAAKPPGLMPSCLAWPRASIQT